MTIVFVTAMVLAGIPAGLAGLAPHEEGGAAPRAITDDGNDLIVPDGETYELSGCHTYAVSVQINGILKVTPYDGTSASTGMLYLMAPKITIGSSGRILGDGRGYGGGGGGSCHYSGSAQGGYGGRSGMGGNGADGSDYYSGGGGGGSPGGQGGRSGGYSRFTSGDPGTDTAGGDGGGYTSWGDGGGKGGTGYGGGGGGAGDDYYGGGGGGGGGSGGKDASTTTGGNGGGPFGGKGGPSRTYGDDAIQYPGHGGYMTPEGNGDSTMDMSVYRGSGGGGGGSGSYYVGGGGGGGGAGGASVTLYSTGDLTVAGGISTTGSSGGKGGNTWDYYTGCPGGGGAGGGVALVGNKVVVTGVVDARGSMKDGYDTSNGGTIKMSYTQKDVAQGTFLSGRMFANGKPKMNGLVSPPDQAEVVPVPVFLWNDATDPDDDPVVYHLQVATDEDFDSTIIDATNLKKTTYTSPGPLASGTTYYWHVAPYDPVGPGDWSETWSFGIDKTPPVSKVNDLPKYMTTTDFEVSWSGEDNAAGIKSYTIYVSDNNQGFIPWLIDTTKESSLFIGKDGHNYRFYSSAVDRAENREAAHLTADAATSVDISPPASTLDYVDPYVNTTQLTLSWSAKDATSGVANYTVYVSVDNGEFEPWLSKTTARTGTYNTEEGHMYQFYVRAYDNAGNLEPVPEGGRILTVKIDLTPPYTMINMGWPTYGERPIYILPTNNMVLSNSDNYVGVNMTYYQIDGQLVKDYTGPFRETQFGSHNMTYWSVDYAGNEESRQTIWFFTDGEGPTTTLSFDGPNFLKSNVVYISAETRIVLEARDRGSGVNRTEYYFDNADRTTYTDPFRLTQPGSHVLYYRSSDNLGTAETEKNLRMALDTIPPVTTPSYPVGAQNKDVSIRLRASDYESGLAGTFYRVLKAGEVMTDWTDGNELVLTASDDHSEDGNYRVEFYSTDGVGNNEIVKYIMVAIDTQAALTVSIKGGEKVDSEKYTVNGKAEPGAHVSINGNPVTVLNDGTFSASVSLKEGSNKLLVTSTDPAGNTVSVSKTVEYAPPLTIGAPVVMMLIVVLIVVAMAGAVLALRKKG